MAQKPKYLELSPEDLTKVQRSRERREASVVEVPDSYLILAEFGLFFGWEGVRAVLEDYITLEQAVVLTHAARRFHASDVYDSAIANLAGNSHKKEHFTSLMRPFMAVIQGAAK